MMKDNLCDCLKGLVWFMVFDATFNNVSVILWLSFLLVEETRVPGENHVLKGYNSYMICIVGNPIL
jgi:hypothetical protein